MAPFLACHCAYCRDHPGSQAGTAMLCLEQLSPHGSGFCHLFLCPLKGTSEWGELKPQITHLEGPYPGRADWKTQCRISRVHQALPPPLSCKSSLFPNRWLLQLELWGLEEGGGLCELFFISWGIGGFSHSPSSGAFEVFQSVVASR